MKLPPLEIVTLADDKTPAVKAAVVPPPTDKVPVEVRSAVPVKILGPLLQILLFASLAVILILNETSVICDPILPPPEDSTNKLLSVPGFIVNELLTPFSLPPVRVAVRVKLPVLEIITAEVDKTPAVKEAVIPPPKEMFPEDVRFTVPVKTFGPLLHTLLPASLAVILILKEVPAICEPIFPPEDASTRKLLTTPVFMGKELLVPF